MASADLPGNPVADSRDASRVRVVLMAPSGVAHDASDIFGE